MAMMARAPQINGARNSKRAFGSQPMSGEGGILKIATRVYCLVDGEIGVDGGGVGSEAASHVSGRDAGGEEGQEEGDGALGIEAAPADADDADGGGRLLTRARRSRRRALPGAARRA